jgi:hypothetical protein
MGDRINRANTIAQSLTLEDDRAVLISMRLAIVDAQMAIKSQRSRIPARQLRCSTKMQGRHNSSEILRLGQEPQRHDPEAGGGGGRWRGDRRFQL